jgi:wobble nucleotide-excising tRNase
MSNEIEYRVRDLESETTYHAKQISKISNDLGDIKAFISQIRWFITGGILFLMADRVGFFAALGVM